jgi:hypothetical protein
MLIAANCLQQDGHWVAEIDSSLDCYGVHHVGLALPALAGILSLLVMTSVYKLLIFNAQVSSPNILARRSSFQDFKFHVVRIGLAVLFIGIPDVRDDVTL